MLQTSRTHCRPCCRRAFAAAGIATSFVRKSQCALRKEKAATTALALAVAALAFARPLTRTVVMASSSSTGKRNIEAIDLGSTDEDEPAPKVASSNPSSAIIKVPAGVRMLRGVEVPSGWSVHGGSLLVRTFGDVKGSVAVAAFDFDGCASGRM